MSHDVSQDKLLQLIRQMSDVIETYGYYKGMWTSPAEVVKVRWDTPIFRPSQNPTEVLNARLQGLLKYFESLTIDQRILNRNVLDQLLVLAKKVDPQAALVLLDNVNADEPTISTRYAECQIRFSEFIFEYSNNDFLPTITMRPAKGRSLNFA